jgi:putative transcription antitermination factor YqgF
MLEVIRSRDVGLVVVGFPVREDGYEGAGCRRSRRMQELLDRAGIPAVLWDETGTTREALEVTRRHGLSHRRSRGARDSIAASLILSSYLAAQDQAPRAGRG